MKKAYSKPEIMFEDFSLSASIANGCDVRVTNQSQNTCGYELRTGGTVFFTTVSGCYYTKDPTTHNDIIDGDYGVCYHVPTDTSDLFNS